MQITSLDGLNGASYRVLVWRNNCDTLISGTANIAAENLLVFADHPDDVTICSPYQLSFIITVQDAASVSNLQYQWEVSTDGISWDELSNSNIYGGVNTHQLDVINSTGLYNHQYRCKARSSQCGWTYSTPAALFLQGPINIQMQPEDFYYCEGESYTFNTQLDMPSNANGLLTLQWQISTDSGISWENILEGQSTGQGGIYTGTATSNLHISLADGLDGYQYRLYATTLTCEAVTETATLFNEENHICYPDSNFVSLSLKLLPNKTHWGVFLKPLGSFAPLGNNKLTEAEITIGASHDFIYKNLTSQGGGIWKPGAVWTDAQDPNSFRYYSFYLVPNNNPLGLAAEEVMLFSFTKLTSCPDTLFLMQNDIPNNLNQNKVNGIDLSSSPNKHFYLGGYHDPDQANCPLITKGPNFTTDFDIQLLEINGSPDFEVNQPGQSDQMGQHPSFQFSPNPAKDFVQINMSGIEEHATARIHLVNTQGKVLLKQPTSPNTQLQLDLTSFNAGLYFLLLEVDGEIMQQGKLVIRY